MNTPTTNDVILMLAQLGRQLDAKQEEIARLDGAIDSFVGPEVAKAVRARVKG